MQGNELLSFTEPINMNWKDISLGKFQQLEEINNTELSEMDKVLFSACIVFDRTEYQLDNEEPKKVLKMTTKMQEIFETPFNPRAHTKVGKYLLNYDVSSMTFGQYIELAFFLSEKPIQNAHYILATIANRRFRKHTARDHRRKSEYFLQQPVEIVLGALNRITESFKGFNKEYSNLFGVDPDVAGDVQDNIFNKRFGWIYSATQVAIHEGKPLDDIFGLPVRRALNALIFLKAKGKYEMEQLRKSNKSLT